MTTFPNANVLGNPTVTTASFQSAIEAFLAATKQLPGGQAHSNLTIAGGNITPTAAYHRVDTQGAAATDDLDHAIVTNLPQGSLLILKSVNSARSVVVRHAIAGAGQFIMSDAANFTLASITMAIGFIREASDTWVEVFRDYGSNAAGNRTYLGLGSVALLNQGTSSGQTPAHVPRVDDIVGRRHKDWRAVDFRAPHTNGPVSFGVYQQQNALTPDGLPSFGPLAGGLMGSGWSFSDTVGNSIHTTWVPPKRWNKSNVFWQLHWVGQSGAANGVRWGVAMHSIGQGESLDSATYSVEGGVTQTNSGSNTLNITSEISVAPGGTPTDGEMVFIRIRRDPSNGGDTLAAGAILIGARMFYNINALRDD